MKFRSLIFLILFSGISSIHSETFRVLDSGIRFVAIHPFKTVHADCGGVAISPDHYTVNESIGLEFPKSIRIEFPVQEIRSGDKSRDEHIAESLGYPKYKTVQFESKQIILKGESLTVLGILTVNGIGKEIKSLANVRRIGQEIRIEGSFQVLMSDFNVEPPSLLFAVAKQEVTIEYEFVLKP